MVKKVKKRDGRISNFKPLKILSAIERCIEGTELFIDSEHITKKIVDVVEERYEGKRPSVEHIQDIVEEVLMKSGHHDIAKRYILYRQERTNEREKDTHLMRIMDGVFNQSSEENDSKRDNANTNADTAMGTMLKIGSESSKEFYSKHLIKKEYMDEHQSGLIHIHDMDFYKLTTTCCQIDLEKLLKNGFSTGNGSIRPPQSIRTALSLVAIVLQSNQNDQHGGQSISNFDWDLAPYIKLSYDKHLRKNVSKYCIVTDMNEKDIRTKERIKLEELSLEDTRNECYQGCEALIHNLNTMSSRAGACRMGTSY